MMLALGNWGKRINIWYRFSNPLHRKLIRRAYVTNLTRFDPKDPQQIMSAWNFCCIRSNAGVPKAPNSISIPTPQEVVSRSSTVSTFIRALRHSTEKGLLPSRRMRNNRAQGMFAPLQPIIAQLANRGGCNRNKSVTGKWRLGSSKPCSSELSPAHL